MSDLLAGCHYRQGETYTQWYSRADSVEGYSKSREIWGALYRAKGDAYRLTYSQVLGRLATSLDYVRRTADAITAWDELREVLAPLHERDPAYYAPVLAGILRYEAKAARDLGDEARAAGFEAEEI